MAEISFVAWRNRAWSRWGQPYGYYSGHNNHAHLEVAPGSPQHVIVPVGLWFQRHGFRVGQHPQFGGVDPVHEGRAHYEGRAIDVNFGPSGENDIEKRAFDAYIPRLIRQGTPLSFFTAPTIVDDMPDEAYFNNKFAELKTILARDEQEGVTFLQSIHDSITRRDREQTAKIIAQLLADRAFAQTVHDSIISRDREQTDEILAELTDDDNKE